jgi:hypothetical protein
MNASVFSARPVRIRIDDVVVNGTGDTGGKDIYQLAALGEGYALFRKVSAPREDLARVTEPRAPGL